MPRNYRKKRSYSKRPGYGACGKMVYGDAQKALAMVKSVKRLINVEVKNFDTQLTNTAVTDAIGITQLTNIPQGDTRSTRDGAQCKMIGLELNFAISMHASAFNTQFRLIVVLDKQTNQAVYLAADLLDDITPFDSIISPRNLDNMKRFAVLYDRTFAFHVGGTNSFIVRKYIKKEVLLRYDASTSTIADLTQNSLSILTVATEPANDPGFTLHARIRYVDN